MTYLGICNKVLHLNRAALTKQFDFQTMNTLMSNRNICLNSSRKSFTINMENERETFMTQLPKVINSLQNDPKFFEIPEAAEWMKKVLENNVTEGKHTSGLTTVTAFKVLQKHNKITEDSLNLARTMGWCVEIAYFMILDDIIDGSVIRGSPCWYRRPDVGLACAVNDSVIVNSALFQVLKTHFAHLPNYIDMVHLVNETVWHTSIGQHLDYKTAQNKKDYNKFTIDSYFTIVKYKSGYYTFYLPITLAMLLVGNVEQEIIKHTLPICLKMGNLFQIQDDFIDCFGKEDITGKTGTDIQEGKCSWLAVNALSQCSDKQRIVFKACYGSDEPAHLERIKRLYEELRLPELYKREERTIYEDILRLINAVPCEDTRQLFDHILNKQIFKGNCKNKF